MAERFADFRDLDAWQSAMDLAVAVYGVAGRLPPTNVRTGGADAAGRDLDSEQRGRRARPRRRSRTASRRIALGSLAELERSLRARHRDRACRRRAGEVSGSTLRRERRSTSLQGLRRDARRQVPLLPLVGASILPRRPARSTFGRPRPLRRTTEPRAPAARTPMPTVIMYFSVPTWISSTS